jgi:FkbM family methyltransferase
MSRLIYDVGMHNGSDTEFYLRKGFDVIAIEANPKYVAHARARFAKELATGQLTIYDVALTEKSGEVPFFVHEHDDWSRLNPNSSYRFTEGTYQEIKVRGLQFSLIAGRHPTPYYVKLDIEGSERMVIEQLFATGKYPPFLSFEANLETDLILNLLDEHGYHEFQLLGQSRKSQIRLPNPPLEGTFYDARFNGYMSGPFGLELQGEWVSILDLRDQLKAHKRKVQEGKDKLALNEWHDIHARLPSGASAPRGSSRSA